MSRPGILRSAVPAGEWVAVSGQVGARDGELVGGARAQAAQALVNLREVLARHGAQLSDVVKVNVFLVTMRDYDAVNAEYAAVFTTNPPARTAVAVSELPFGALVEIEAWAYRPSAD